MPPRKKQPAAIAVEPEAKTEPTSLPVVAPVTPPTGGYRRAPRYEWIEYRPDELPKDAEGLKVLIQSNLSYRESEAIPYGMKLQLSEIWAGIVQYIRDWNLQALNAETGEYERVPASAISDPDVWRLFDEAEIAWLILAIKYKHRQKVAGAAGKKDLTTSEPTASP